jgi:hypothetical protein
LDTGSTAKQQTTKGKTKMDNKQITITETTARRAMERLSDWLEWVEDLDAETRADILALDELIKALDAEAEYQKLLDEKRERMIQNNKARAAKKETEKAAN